jgi:hypothetical protein
MKRLPLLFAQLFAFPLLSVAQSVGPESQIESRDVKPSAPGDFKTAVAPLLAKYCTSCHGGDKPKNDLSLEFGDAQDVEQRLASDRALFERMTQRIRLGEMPPENRPKPSEAEKDVLVTWIDRDVLGIEHGPSHRSGQVARVRRLTRVEYENTVRDLFYFKDFKAEDLPPDEIGYGFNNIADLLNISPNQLELYLKTAERAIAQLDATAKPSPNWAKNDKTYWEPDDGVFLPIKDVELRFNNNQVRVRKVLEAFLPRAYRRPVKKEEIDRLIVFAQLSLTQEGESFVRPKSVYAPLRAALCSPYFLYRVEQDPLEGTAPINEYELASRLSYFLWSSMPDDELFKLAEENQLRAHQDEQVRRMLKDPKARALTDNFAEQWLHLAGIKRAAPDPKIFPDFDESLRQAMCEETVRFVKHVIADDLSIMDFLDADYTFLNERLAKHYGIDGVSGEEFRMVTLDPSLNRGGILTQASILTLSSPPTRTSPVKRGVWILQTLFNDPPSPPPADVPPLDEGKVLTGTVRQVLEAHRANAQCASCHSKIDPYGLALENFNGIGAWRTKESATEIDASGSFPNDKSYRDLTEFRALLKERKDDFRKAFAENLLIYALGRGLENSDRGAVQQVCSAAATVDDHFSGLILAIVNTDQFQKRTATGN